MDRASTGLYRAGFLTLSWTLADCNMNREKLVCMAIAYAKYGGKADIDTRSVYQHSCVVSLRARMTSAREIMPSNWPSALITGKLLVFRLTIN